MHINTKNIVVSCIFSVEKGLFVKFFVQRYIFLHKKLFFFKEIYYFCSRNLQSNNYYQYMNKSLLTAILMLMGINVWAQRSTINLKTWEFTRSKQYWYPVTVPHDWAISRPFDKNIDLQVVRIEQNGEQIATEKSGRTGSLPWIGEGFYRTSFNLGRQQFADMGRCIIEFDGAMSEPTVFVNGQKAGYWPYGYNAFRLDITKLVKEGKNDVEVNLVNLEESSRWYPGAGIYRPVKVMIVPEFYLDPWESSIRTIGFAQGVNNYGKTKLQARVEYETQIQTAPDVDKSQFDDMSFVVEVLNDSNRFEAGSHYDVPADGHIKTMITVTNPHVWSPETPYLYKMRARLFNKGELVDEIITNFGIRTIEVGKDGFKLNGSARKIQGVCLHHDLGPLGAAINKAALIRQIKLMKDMGCDAIRTAHNMPSQMQMDICDSLGMMVMAESFDSWIQPKCKNGYSRFFKEWAEKDLTNLLVGHRNHPSIVMWSIGNEIPEQTDPVVGVEWSKKLQELCHKLDPTRPVTQGLDRVDAAIKSKVAATMDIVGLNYRTHRYQYAYDKCPQKFVLGTETGSTVSSRGVYKLPFKTSNYAHYDDGQCSSYDNEWCSWSNLPDVDFENMEDLPWTIGQFVWTGIDYLGEPTPYDEYWPSRSSYFGICDLAGLPKDRYYLYRSVWNKKDHTLHVLPHWTWEKERIGHSVPVIVYTDFEEAEVFINGKSQGRKAKNHFINCDESGNQITGQSQTNPNGEGRWDTRYDTSVAPNLDRFRLRWWTKYEPGELKVVAYDKDGEPVAEEVIHTAGYESQLKLEPDVTTIKADGDDLCYITVSLNDKDGNLCPDSDDEVLVAIEGEGRFRAICNGDPTSTELFVEPHMRLFHGKLVVTIQSTEKPGDIKVTVTRPSGNYRDKNGKKFSQQMIENSVTIKSVK